MTGNGQQLLAELGGLPHSLLGSFALGDIHDDFHRGDDTTLLVSHPGRVLERHPARMLGATHAEVGAYLLGLWDLPHAIVEPVAFHYSLVRVGQNGFDTLTVVALADALAYDAVERTGGQESRAVFDRLASIGDPKRWRGVAVAEAAPVGISCGR